MGHASILDVLQDSMIVGLTRAGEITTSKRKIGRGKNGRESSMRGQSIRFIQAALQHPAARIFRTIRNAIRSLPTHQRGTSLLRRLGSLPRLSTPGLVAQLALLLLLLAQLHSTCACDGLGTEIRAVALLGGGVDDGLVDLTARGVGGEGGGLGRLCGLVAAVGQLGGQGEGVGRVGVDADGLRNVCELVCA